MSKREQISASVMIAVLIITIIYIQHERYRETTSHTVGNLLKTAYSTFDIPKKGVIHIGAHIANELWIYATLGVPKILWIEADPGLKERLLESIKDDSRSSAAFFAATDVDGETLFHRTTNDGASSSIYKLKNHVNMSPTVKDAGTIKVPQRRLDSYFASNHLNSNEYNVIVIDVQGAELVALKGAGEMLKTIDAILAEVNYDELYAGAVLVQDLDHYLSTYNFIRVDTVTATRGFGDALYVKRKFCDYSKANGLLSKL